MDTTKEKSTIEKIHDRGMQAIIDGDNQKIVGESSPDHIKEKIASLEASGKYSDVSQDADGDIVYYV